MLLTEGRVGNYAQTAMGISIPMQKITKDSVPQNVNPSLECCKTQCLLYIIRELVKMVKRTIRRMDDHFKLKPRQHVSGEQVNEFEGRDGDLFIIGKQIFHLDIVYKTEATEIKRLVALKFHPLEQSRDMKPNIDKEEIYLMPNTSRERVDNLI